MHALVLTDHPLVRNGLSMLLEQCGYQADAPLVESIGQALQLVQDALYRLVIIDDGWRDGARLSLLMARLAPQSVQVAVLRHPRPADPRAEPSRGLDGTSFWIDPVQAPDPMWHDLDDRLQEVSRPAPLGPD